MTKDYDKELWEIDQQIEKLQNKKITVFNKAYKTDLLVGKYVKIFNNLGKVYIKVTKATATPQNFLDTTLEGLIIEIFPGAHSLIYSGSFSARRNDIIEVDKKEFKEKFDKIVEEMLTQM